jgi:hypothetical protein
MESISPSKIADITGYLFFFEGVCGYIFSPLLLLWFKNTKSLLIIALAFNLIAMGVMAWIRPGEGVRFWLTHGKFKEAREEIGRRAL